MIPARAKFSVAQLSNNACVVSSFAMPASASLSVSAVPTNDSSFSSSFLLVGTMNARVKGMMLGSRTAAMTLSLKGVEALSSVR